MSVFRRQAGERGFSLVELLVTVAIIGVLAAIAVPVYTGQRTKAVVASMETDARTNAAEIAAAMADYTNNGGRVAQWWNVTTSGTNLTIPLGTGYKPSSMGNTRTVKILLSQGNTLTGRLKTNSIGYCIKITNDTLVTIYDENGMQRSKTNCNNDGVAV